MGVSAAKLGGLLKVTASKQSSESQHSLPRSGQSSPSCNAGEEEADAGQASLLVVNLLAYLRG